MFINTNGDYSNFITLLQMLSTTTPSAMYVSGEGIFNIFVFLPTYVVFCGLDAQPDSFVNDFNTVTRMRTQPDIGS